MASRQNVSLAGALCLVLVSATTIGASTINEYLGKHSFFRRGFLQTHSTRALMPTLVRSRF